MTAIYDQIRELSEQDFRELKTWLLLEESVRRAQEPAVRAGQQEIIAGLQEAGTLPKPEYANTEDVKPEATFPDWVSPGTNHALMYPRGAVVKNNDRVWESQLDMNHWEPGAFGVDERIWLDITRLTEQREAEEVEGGEEDGAEAPQAVIPFGPGLPLAEGDIVEYKGDKYRVTSAHSSADHWPPDEAHALFQKL